MWEKEKKTSLGKLEGQIQFIHELETLGLNYVCQSMFSCGSADMTSVTTICFV